MTPEIDAKVEILVGKVLIQLDELLRTKGEKAKLIDRLGVAESYFRDICRSSKHGKNISLRKLLAILVANSHSDEEVLGDILAFLAVALDCPVVEQMPIPELADDEELVPIAAAAKEELERANRNGRDSTVG
jgi:hypothetical protein